MSLNALFEINDPDTPIITIALHDGHEIRSDIKPHLFISDTDRLREEDPTTGQWTQIVDNRIIVGTSRFEVDLNHCRDRAVYIKPEDSWGLTVWKQKPTEEIVNQSLSNYDDFYKDIHAIYTKFQKQFKQFVVFDFHAYNHLRNGPKGIPADSEKNPEVNIGTGTMKRDRWAHIIDRFKADLSAFDYMGRNLDVRENIKFYGRQLAQFTHNHFPDSACVLSVEFKKFFMDEWTGYQDPRQVQAIIAALKSTLPGILKELNKSS